MKLFFSLAKTPREVRDELYSRFEIVVMRTLRTANMERLLVSMGELSTTPPSDNYPETLFSLPNIVESLANHELVVLPFFERCNGPEKFQSYA